MPDEAPKPTTSPGEPEQPGAPDRALEGDGTTIARDPVPEGDPALVAARTAERRRSVLVIAASAVLSALVMGGVIVLALGARSPAEDSDDDLLATLARPSFPGDPAGLRTAPWPDEGCAPDPKRPADIKLDVPTGGVDFGRVKQGEVQERVVSFRSTGKGPLCIRSVTTTCGCFKVRLEGGKQRYEPGEEGRILITLDPAGREGPQHKRVDVATNRAPLSFPVHADIGIGLLVSPPRANFERVAMGSPSSAKVRLRSPQADAAWEVVDVVGAARQDRAPVTYRFEVREVPDPRSRVRELVIEHPGYETQGQYRESLRILTTHPERPEILLEGILHVVAPILAFPGRAVLGFVPPAREVAIRLEPGDPSATFEVEGVSFEDRDGEPLEEGASGFRAAYARDEKGRWILTVGHDGQVGRPGPVQATLVVRTDLERHPVVRVPCFATIAPREGG